MHTCVVARNAGQQRSACSREVCCCHQPGHITRPQPRQLQGGQVVRQAGFKLADSCGSASRFWREVLQAAYVELVEAAAGDEMEHREQLDTEEGTQGGTAAVPDRKGSATASTAYRCAMKLQQSIKSVNSALSSYTSNSQTIAAASQHLRSVCRRRSATVSPLPTWYHSPCVLLLQSG